MKWRYSDISSIFFFFLTNLVGHRIIRGAVTIAFHFKGSNIPAQRYYDRIIPESNWSCVANQGTVFPRLG